MIYPVTLSAYITVKKSVDFTIKYMASDCQFICRYFFLRTSTTHPADEVCPWVYSFRLSVRSSVRACMCVCPSQLVLTFCAKVFREVFCSLILLIA